MQLKHVVLPEPFGPMRPRISPSRTSKETALSAMNPPKRFVSAEIVSTVLFERRLCRRNSVAGRRYRKGGRSPPSESYRAANGEDAGSGRTGGAVATVLG